MKNKRYTVAVIGVGHQAMKEYIPFITSHPKLLLAALIDVNTSLLDRLEKTYHVPVFSSVPHMLEIVQPDIAVVCVPHCEYKTILGQLFNANIAVFKEKPFACSLKEAKTLHKMIVRRRRLFMVHVQRRYDLYYQSIVTYLKDIGTPFFVEGHYFIHVPDPHVGWRGNKDKAGGGCIIDMGYHLIDLLLLYLGIPDEVCATYGSFAKAEKYDAEDTASILVRYTKRNIFGSLSLSRFIGPKQEMLRIVGTKGYIKISNTEAELCTNDGKVTRTIRASDFAKRHALDYFVDVMEKRKPNISSSAIHMAHSAFIDACYRSGKTHRFTHIQQLRKGAL